MDEPISHVQDAHMAIKGKKAEPDKDLGVTFLRAWRVANGLTLEEVAEHLGMTHASLSRMERGKQPYNQVVLEAVAPLYNCTPADLLSVGPPAAASPERMRTLRQAMRTFLDLSIERQDREIGNLIDAARAEGVSTIDLELRDQVGSTP